MKPGDEFEIDGRIEVIRRITERSVVTTAGRFSHEVFKQILKTKTSKMNLF